MCHNFDVMPVPPSSPSPFGRGQGEGELRKTQLWRTTSCSLPCKNLAPASELVRRVIAIPPCDILPTMPLDLNLARSAIKSALPRSARWLIATDPLDFDFSLDRYDFRRISDRDVVGGVPVEWDGCLAFGFYDYCE